MAHHYLLVIMQRDMLVLVQHKALVSIQNTTYASPE